MNGKLKIFLLGAMRVIDADGRDVTPRSATAQGLLAILAVSAGQPWNRSALQDLLWSDRGHGHGRDSLKKALRDLRKILNAAGGEVLRLDAGRVWLDMSRVSVDVFEPSERGAASMLSSKEFLSGIDVRDPQFEEWLRETRSAFERHGADRIAQDYWHMTRRRVHIALLPPKCQSRDAVVQARAEMLLNRVLLTLKHYDVYKVHDLRSREGADFRGGDFTIGCGALSADDSEIVLSLICRRTVDGEVVWGGTYGIPRGPGDADLHSGLVSEIVESLNDSLFRRSDGGDSDRHVAARFAMDGIDRIFSLSKADLKRSAASLRRAVELDPRSTYYAWYAFLATFRLEDTKGKDLPELVEHGVALARRAMEIDPLNPLTRSILTHVYSFLLRDFGQAELLIAPLDRSTPELPMFHQSRALLNFYTGRLDQAEFHAGRARVLGGMSPNAYAFATTQAMVALAKGQADASIRFGREALCLQAGRERVFEPTLRYLAAAYACSGDRPAALKTLADIKAQSPDFSIESMRAAEFPIPSERARKVLLRALGPLERDFINE